MGYISHHSILVTSFCHEAIGKAHNKANKIMPDLVSKIIKSRINEYYSFCIFPDGSKEGWNDSDIGNNQRDIFINWINKQRYEDNSSIYDWIEIEFGGDNEINKILRSKNDVKLKG